MSLVGMNWHPERAELRRFSAIWLPAFLALAGALLFLTSRPLWVPLIVWSAAVMSVAAGLWAPNTMKPVYVAMNCLALPIGWITSYIVLIFVFFIVITPIGLVMRLTGRDPMQRTFDRMAGSYWSPRRQSGDPGRFFRQF